MNHVPIHNRRWAGYLSVFLVALTVRAIYLIDSGDNPTFDAPVIDSARYDGLARALAADERVGAELFWQPYFYPVYLGWVYRVFGPTIPLARALQLLLGCATCLLTVRLGVRLADGRSGLLAGLACALYGPLFFFEAELLAVGFATFWSVALLLLLLRARQGPCWWSWLALGMIGALSVLTRPTFLPFFCVASLWLILACLRSLGWSRVLGLSSASLVLGFLAVVFPVAAENHRATGHFSFLPFSGGINLFIGNNPDFCELVQLRPGQEWKELNELPARSGVPDEPGAQQAFFLDRTLGALGADPLGFLERLGGKSIRFVSGREIPRNLDIYVFGQWSGLLRALTWKLGGFGFPFGVLLPLAVVGLVARRGWGTPVWLFVSLYPAAVVVFFVSARYRLPVVPLLAICASWGVFAMRDWVQSRRLVPLGWAALLAAAVALVGSLPGPFCEEGSVHPAELYLGSGAYRESQGDLKRATQLYQQAVEQKPDLMEAHFNLGLAYLRTQNASGAIEHMQTVIALQNDHVEAHAVLAAAYAAEGLWDPALKMAERAMRLSANLQDPQERWDVQRRMRSLVGIIERARIAR